ncbi:MAG: hypothetical protein ACRYHB_08460 [Janthinobacterium lividum]
MQMGRYGATRAANHDARRNQQHQQVAGIACGQGEPTNLADGAGKLCVGSVTICYKLKLGVARSRTIQAMKMRRLQGGAKQQQQNGHNGCKPLPG